MNKWFLNPTPCSFLAKKNCVCVGWSVVQRWGLVPSSKYQRLGSAWGHPAHGVPLFWFMWQFANVTVVHIFGRDDLEKLLHLVKTHLPLHLCVLGGLHQVELYWTQRALWLWQTLGKQISVLGPRASSSCIKTILSYIFCYHSEKHMSDKLARPHHGQLWLTV